MPPSALGLPSEEWPLPLDVEVDADRSGRPGHGFRRGLDRVPGGVRPLSQALPVAARVRRFNVHADRTGSGGTLRAELEAGRLMVFHDGRQLDLANGSRGGAPGTTDRSPVPARLPGPVPAVWRRSERGALLPHAARASRLRLPRRSSMAVPKRRHSSTRGKKRRTHWKLKTAVAQPVRPLRTAPSCRIASARTAATTGRRDRRSRRPREPFRARDPWTRSRASASMRWEATSARRSSCPAR